MKAQDLRILLVDDFEMVRTILKNILINLGYTRIEEAGDGKVAWDMINKAKEQGEPYSLVFCDWNMPEMTGFDVLKLVRGHEAFRALPFVMVTAESEQDSMVRALEAGATEYLIKPISPDVLGRKVTRIVEKMQKAAA